MVGPNQRKADLRRLQLWLDNFIDELAGELSVADEQMKRFPETKFSEFKRHFSSLNQSKSIFHPNIRIGTQDPSPGNKSNSKGPLESSSMISSTSTLPAGRYS